MEHFELLEHTYITELDSQAKRYIHKPTGAEILSYPIQTRINALALPLKPPPSNSTGIAHILEHTVLCGSKKYPLKDPFVQLLKGSLQTFLNAFTYPDKTCYPIASQNLQDFYNLTDVYLDAVFNPLLTEDFFQQEGWHYFLENASDPLTYKGVVYNEMKGVYSSAESLLMERTQQSLFPDTTYGLDSGGDPDHIPQLTYEEFKQFHAAYYHPSNARIIFYGDDPEDKRLELIRPYLDAFQSMKETLSSKNKPHSQQRFIKRTPMQPLPMIQTPNPCSPQVGYFPRRLIIKPSIPLHCSTSSYWAQMLLPYVKLFLNRD